MSSYQVLVVNDGVPGCLFDADDWNHAIHIVLLYCKEQNIDITNINGEDWSEALESDGMIEDGGTCVYVVQSESFPEWLAAQSQ